MMRVAVAVVLSLAATLAPQDPPSQEDLAKKVEELAKRVEALEKERARLLEQVENLERFGKEAAETISKLKQMVANGGSRGPAPAEPNPETPGAKKETSGPTSPVHGKILMIVPDHSFMIVNLGEEDGVKEGWMFEVIRVVRETDGKVRNELLGKAVFEKYVETARNTQSKLKIVEGDPEKMKYGDSVVANRKLEPIPPPKEGGDKTAAKPEARKFRIFGITGDTYHIDAGSRDGLKQSDKVYVFRDKRAIAQLRLDRVDRDVSAGKIIDGTKSAEPAQDDDVLLKDPKVSLVGKVKRIETTGDATGAWIEVGKQQGAKMGMQFEVRRQGKVIGKLVVKTLGTYHSVCDAVAPMVLEDLKTDDFIESVE